jgi:hypothetical protein
LRRLRHRQRYFHSLEPFPAPGVFYDFAEVDRAMGDSHAGGTVKPILKMPY